MKRFFLRLLVLALAAAALAAGAWAEEAEEPAVYTAKTNVELHLKPEPGSQRWVTAEAVPPHTRLEVLEWGESWCRVRFHRAVGYTETRLLRELIALEPLEHPVPGLKPCTGLWVFNRETPIVSADFSGLTARPGTAAAVREEDRR